eukprot:765815-Hanusia_phi.AAC.1
MAAVNDAKTNLQGMPKTSEAVPLQNEPVEQPQEFQSQWAKMHPASSSKQAIEASAKHNKLRTVSPSNVAQRTLAADADKDLESKRKEAQAQLKLSQGGSRRSESRLLKAMDHISKRGLEKLVKVLIDSKSAAGGSGSSGEAYQGINRLLHREQDADRLRQANELHAVREVMDDLVERMKRRRQEEREDRNIMKSLASRLREPSAGRDAGRKESERSKDLEILSKLLRSRAS